MTTPTQLVSLSDVKRWPSKRTKMAGMQVRIWSGEHRSYWRPMGNGYCWDTEEAGVFDFEDAYNRTSHCGPEKKIVFHIVEVEFSI